MINVLFVCLGNICRSPLAEAIFKHKVEQRGLSHVYDADSAGTASYHIGSFADKRSITAALQRGIGLTYLNHKARAFHNSDFERFTYIIAMDQHNLAHINRLMPEDTRAGVLLMRSFDVNDRNADVPDPYYGTQRDFDQVFDILDHSCEGLLDFLVSSRQAQGAVTSHS